MKRNMLEVHELLKQNASQLPSLKEIFLIHFEEMQRIFKNLFT